MKLMVIRMMFCAFGVVGSCIDFKIVMGCVTVHKPPGVWNLKMCHES